MTSLPSLLGSVMAILQAYPGCRSAAVMETKEFSSDQFFFKIRAELTEEHKLQVRIYYNQGHIDYAYQLFTDVPLLRWDNKEEFQHLETYPHHHHDEQGNIKPSPLIGDPMKDLGVVLQEVSTFLSGVQDG
ncbi:MAG: hypothetical protein D6791_08675 [Chloroflexi bacterium]|nr:MAG: hypothetical protein D6791_08675 [Chloroflexota bacterium]